MRRRDTTDGRGRSATMRHVLLTSAHRTRRRAVALRAAGGGGGGGGGTRARGRRIGSSSSCGGRRCRQITSRLELESGGASRAASHRQRRRDHGLSVATSARGAPASLVPGTGLGGGRAVRAGARSHRSRNATLDAVEPAVVVGWRPACTRRLPRRTARALGIDDLQGADDAARSLEYLADNAASKNPVVAKHAMRARPPEPTRARGCSLAAAGVDLARAPTARSLREYQSMLGTRCFARVRTVGGSRMMVGPFLSKRCLPPRWVRPSKRWQMARRIPEVSFP